MGKGDACQVLLDSEFVVSFNSSNPFPILPGRHAAVATRTAAERERTPRVEKSSAGTRRPGRG